MTTNTPVTSITRRNPESIVQTKPVHQVKPSVDVYESTDELLMLADMPGASAESVAVRLEGAQLTLEAERTLPRGDAVRYCRAFRMPSTIDPDGISADLKEGVLHVHLKKSEAAKPRVIPIHSS